jgi:hypothetical protein
MTISPLLHSNRFDALVDSVMSMLKMKMRMAVVMMVVVMIIAPPFKLAA